MTHTETPVTVVQIVGLGRSGSTILDIILGNHPDIHSVGEVANLARTGWISRESLRGIVHKQLRIPLCTCGKRLDVPNVDSADEACPFWSSVRREWVERVGQDDIERYPRLQDAFERQRRWPRLLLRERREPSPQFLSYARLTRALFESIRAVSGKPIIVDSSKSPVGAFAFATIPGIDLRVIHLVRDGRGVISSRRKSFRKDVKAGIEWDHEAQPMWTSIIRWVGLNLESEWVASQLGPKKAMRLRYEDFVDDPKNALDRIGSLTSLDLTEIATAVTSGEPLRIGHNVGGNRERKSESVKLRSDAGKWKGTLSTSEQRLSWILMGWLLSRYGYKR